MKKTISVLCMCGILIGLFTACKPGAGVQEETSQPIALEFESESRGDSFQESPVSKFSYSENDEGGITITSYNGSEEQIVIPAMIDNQPVTVIAFSLFLNNSAKSIVIPESVTFIEEASIWSSENLTQFIVKEDNKNYSSQDGVLYNKDKSKLISCPAGKQGTYIVPNGVKSLGEYAFCYCLNLTSVTISSEVETIGSQAFAGCFDLTNINVDKENSFYSSLDGVLYNKTQTGLVFVPGSKAGTFKIPDGVTDIGAYSFYTCKNLSSIEIPNSVTSIGKSAFSECHNLKEIVIPNGVNEIQESVFLGCKGLTTVVIPESVTEIGRNAFSYCTNLSNIELPKGLLGIGAFAFCGCTALTEIVIPENVETVGAWIFSECTHVNVYVKQASQPTGWDSSWNYLNFPVEWGYTGS